MKALANNPTGLNIEAISPKTHERYSPNLYAWLTHKRRARIIDKQRIYKDPEGQLWIGHMDEEGGFTGNRLMGILCNGRHLESLYHGKPKGFREVKTFWTRYIKYGRCAIDPHHTTHFANSEGRWIWIVKDSRTCEWCGQSQILRRWTEKVERTKWENQ